MKKILFAILFLFAVNIHAQLYTKDTGEQVIIPYTTDEFLQFLQLLESIDTTVSASEELPDQSGNDGKVLGTDGSDVAWVDQVAPSRVNSISKDSIISAIDYPDDNTISFINKALNQIDAFALDGSTITLNDDNEISVVDDVFASKTSFDDLVEDSLKSYSSSISKINDTTFHLLNRYGETLDTFYVSASEGSGVSEFSALYDVALDNPTNGQMLYFDASGNLYNDDAPSGSLSANQEDRINSWIASEYNLSTDFGSNNILTDDSNMSTELGNILTSFAGDTVILNLPAGTYNWSRTSSTNYKTVSGDGTVIILRGVPGKTIIRGTSTDGTGYTGFYMRDNSSLQIEDIIFEDMNTAVIVAHDADGIHPFLVIRRCVFRGISQNDQIRFFNNTSYATRKLMYLEVTDCEFTGSISCMKVSGFTSNALVANNFIHDITIDSTNNPSMNSWYGIQLGQDNSIQDYEAGTFKVYGNIIKDVSISRDITIYACRADGYDATFFNNTIYNFDLSELSGGSSREVFYMKAVYAVVQNNIAININGSGGSDIFSIKGGNTSRWKIFSGNISYQPSGTAYIESGLICHTNTRIHNNYWINEGDGYSVTIKALFDGSNAYYHELDIRGNYIYNLNGSGINLGHINNSGGGSGNDGTINVVGNKISATGKLLITNAQGLSELNIIDNELRQLGTNTSEIADLRNVFNRTNFNGNTVFSNSTSSRIIYFEDSDDVIVNNNIFYNTHSSSSSSTSYILFDGISTSINANNNVLIHNGNAIGNWFNITGTNRIANFKNNDLTASSSVATDFANITAGTITNARFIGNTTYNIGDFVVADESTTRVFFNGNDFVGSGSFLSGGSPGTVVGMGVDNNGGE